MAEERRIVYPLIWLLIALVSMAAVHYWIPLAQYAPPPYHLLGIPVVMLGLTVMVSSAARFRRVETGLLPFDEATVLVTDGFFRYTRNPMYLGMAMLLLGLSLLLGTAGSLLPIPLFVVVIHVRFIIGEERFMERAFGEEYLAYKRRVRRWL